MATNLSEGRLVQGKGYSGKATVVPYELLKSMRTDPYPITISGTNQVTFTLNASPSKPVAIWTGNDFISTEKSFSYTWTSGSNSILDSTGATSTQTASVLGVWYMYVSLSKN